MNDDNLHAIYNRFAEIYEANRGLFDMSEILNDFYSRLEQKRGSLLDLGCGAGEPLARWFIDNGWQVTGVDFSEKMLELAGKYVPEMQAQHGDMREVNFTDGSFDVVTCIYSLFHLPSDDQFSVLAKVYGWLRPGGKALFTYATEHYTGAERFSGYKTFMGEALFYSHETPEVLTKNLRTMGFAVEAMDFREIGGETFLWVTVGKSIK